MKWNWRFSRNETVLGTGSSLHFHLAFWPLSQWLCISPHIFLLLIHFFSSWHWLFLEFPPCLQATWAFYSMTSQPLFIFQIISKSFLIVFYFSFNYWKRKFDWQILFWVKGNGSKESWLMWMSVLNNSFSTICVSSNLPFTVLFSQFCK